MSQKYLGIEISFLERGCWTYKLSSDKLCGSENVGEILKYRKIRNITYRN